MELHTPLSHGFSHGRRLLVLLKTPRPKGAAAACFEVTQGPDEAAPGAGGGVDVCRLLALSDSCIHPCCFITFLSGEPSM